MTIKLLPSIHVPGFLLDNEVDELASWIRDCAEISPHIGEIKGDRHEGRLMADYVKWDYYDDNPSAKKIRDLLDPRFQKIFPNQQTFFHSHILESVIPYQLHSDANQRDADIQTPLYTILIPLENYNSKTVIFNEYLLDTNDFQKFKQTHQPYSKFQLDPKFCSDRLFHIHPEHLKYVSLKETFDWRKGDLFAMDRRYIHCSDNFNAHGIDKKMGIVIWTGTPLE